MEKKKKMENPPPDSHREFLDMDTDEEDFERQESLESEEELFVEPIKPVFDEQDLKKLIQYVKDLTVLPSLKDDDWNENCDTVICEYFKNPSFTLLCIYFKANVLNAQLSIPAGHISNFVYFMRAPWQVLTVDNFYVTIVFGSVNHNTMMFVLKSMECLYVPVALSSNEWLETIKTDLFSNLHKFLMYLTEWIYKPLKLTKLYMPREDPPNIAESNFEKMDLSKDNRQYAPGKLTESEKALIERFESIVRYWIKQIHEVLASMSMKKRRENIVDELEHWTAIYYDLCCLLDQFSNRKVESILRFLENIRSPTSDSLRHLTLQLNKGINQATSNVTYLRILSEACNDLKCPDEIEEPITRILLLILFIWTESPFYNISSNIEILCECVSSQIIYQCQKYVNLQALLDDCVEDKINILWKCISCCETYKIVYDKVTNITAHVKSNRDWNVNEQLIFNRIDTFMQRCYDIIEICNALIVFGRCNKVGSIGGAKGFEYEDYCRRIDGLLYQSLDEIKSTQNILEVEKSTWVKNMQKFRYSVMELENMVKTLIERMFEEVNDIEEGIEAIYAFRHFTHKKSLKDMLRMKWMKMWKILDCEIKHCRSANVMRHREYYSFIFQGQSENTARLCIDRYVERSFQKMIDASDWIESCVGEM
ncbi:dynein heavy chain 2, axonemal [Pseudomyrmex gracilis]|uniref:dynein heavy chain 2, axonemal n=1 Tax=Pseudomyrmex gracilis TaxID=219809 RepID=UPI0009950425|nr:dynein heavy chain 2, axonemal [Pseudomyrmex gracilis]XP_020290403.1 dynein heavy chain 2, axonemal [Pseudomyrmex gracilis]